MSAEVYAQRQKLAEESIRYATSIKIDAMARLGEMLKASEKNKGTQTKGGGQGAGGSMQEPPAIPTLAESGISKKESMYAQSLVVLHVRGCWVTNVILDRV